MSIIIILLQKYSSKTFPDESNTNVIRITEPWWEIPFADYTIRIRIRI